MGAINRIIEKIRTRLHPRVIIATTATEIPYTEALQGGVVVSNLGATGAVTFTLPPAVVGMKVTAIVQAAQELRLDPSGTQTVALPSTGVQSAAGKYIVADAVAEKVQLICLVAGKWDVIDYAGTWVAES